MKKLVVLLTLVAATAAYSQGTLGTVSFVTRVGTTVNALITYGPGGPVTAGAKPQITTSVASGAYTFGGINARAALYAVAGAGHTADQLQIITPSVPFKTAGYAGYVDASYGGGLTDRAVPGTAPTEAATFQIRAWDTGLAPADNTMSFEQAKAIIDAQGAGYYGVGNVFTINSLGGGSIASAALTPAQGFAMNWVPEPSIIGLGILGAAAGLFVFRRRN